jgi:hypothetical protein
VFWTELGAARWIVTQGLLDFSLANVFPLPRPTLFENIRKSGCLSDLCLDGFNPQWRVVTKQIEFAGVGTVIVKEDLTNRRYNCCTYAAGAGASGARLPAISDPSGEPCEHKSVAKGPNDVDLACKAESRDGDHA